MNLPPAAVLLLTLLVHVASALASDLQAPIDLHMDSVNFRYILSWRPGPDTPPGTSYIISRRKQWRSRLRNLLNSTRTSVQLRLKDPQAAYQLEVQAASNHTVSPPATLQFTPYEHTTIGPPVVSLAGCGNCIRVNVSLPPPDRDAGVDDIYTLLDPSFNVIYKRTGGKEATYRAEGRTFTLLNLQRGAEYCVQVHTRIRINHNTRTSNWTCDFSSTQQRRGAPAAIALLTVLGLLVLVALMTSMLCLHYTGFLCKLKALLPGALVLFLHQGYILTPETILPDQVSVNPPRTTDNRRRRNNPTVPQAATGGADEEEEVEEEEDEEEEEEEEERDVYLNQPSKPASGDRSCENSSEVLRKGEGQSQWEGPKEDVTPLDIRPAPPGASLGRVREEVEKMEEEEVQQDCSGDVDLFSVTLATLAGCDQEKGEETGEEAGGAFRPELHTENSESGDHSADEQDGGRTEEGEEEEEEEEEELSEYIRHP